MSISEMTCPLLTRNKFSVTGMQAFTLLQVFVVAYWPKEIDLTLFIYFLTFLNANKFLINNFHLSYNYKYHVIFIFQSNILFAFSMLVPIFDLVLEMPYTDEEQKLREQTVGCYPSVGICSWILSTEIQNVCFGMLVPVLEMMPNYSILQLSCQLQFSDAQF